MFSAEWPRARISEYCIGLLDFEQAVVMANARARATGGFERIHGPGLLRIQGVAKSAASGPRQVSLARIEGCTRTPREDGRSLPPSVAQAVPAYRAGLACTAVRPHCRNVRHVPLTFLSFAGSATGVSPGGSTA